jgi:hypothetical protein
VNRKNGKLSADTFKKQPLLHVFYSPGGGLEGGGG